MVLTVLTFVASAAPPPPPIINGEPASEDIYPMSGAMIIDANLDLGSYGQMQYKGLLCSTTLIAPDVVLLAAHCLDPMSLTGGYGSVTDESMGWTRQADLTDWDGSTTNRDWPDDTVMAWDWVYHENFSLMALQTGIAENFDIGLLFLETPVTDVTPAYLVTEEEAAQIEQGDTVDVVGWGQQVATSGYEQPPSGTYAIKYWGTSTIGAIGAPEFQVGPRAEDVRKCHGDSGGPTFMEVETTSTVTTRQIGVTSHAFDNSDCNRTGGVDTRVDHYLSWIDAELRSRCEDGSRAWCDVPGIIAPPEPVVDPPDDDEEDVVPDGQKASEELAGCACSSAARPITTAWLALPAIGLLFRRRR